jgi:chemotaxis protein MotA
MLAIVGILVVLASVIGGYKMGHGNLSVLIQPAELVIIFGAAIGSLVISSPKKVLVLVTASFKSIMESGEVSKEAYLDLMVLLNRLFRKIRKEGLLAIEADVDNPKQSAIFSSHESIVSDQQALDFICDNLRVIISTSLPAHEFESLLDTDIEIRNHEKQVPVTSISRVADALPGLGIVAAVLGVVLTMGKMSEPPEVLGHSIGAALVGTFLGVLCCYGFVGPIAANLEHKVKEKEIYLSVIKAALLACAAGAAPQTALESARRAIPYGERPTFEELEEAMKKWKEKA